MALDRPALIAAILEESLPFNCSQCGKDYKQTLAEIERLLSMFVPILCPYCGEIQLFDLDDFREAVEILIAIHTLKQQIDED